MPVCDVCDSQLTCSEHGESVSDTLDLVQRCPEKAAVWVSVKDDAGNSVEDVAVQCATSNSKTYSKTYSETDVAGFAYFEQLNPGSYTANVALPEKTPALYKPLETASLSTSVKKGEVKLLKYQLERYAFLKVEVVRKDDESVLLPGVAINVKEANLETALSQKTSNDSSIISYDSIEAGQYEVSLSFPTAEAKAKYRDLGEGWSQSVTLAKGASKKVTFKLEPILKAYIELKFNDPEAPSDNAKARFLPRGMPVKVISSGEKKIDAVIGENGRVINKSDSGYNDKSPAQSAPDKKDHIEIDRSWRWVSLEFPTDKKRWVVCEKRKATAAPAILVEEDDPYSENTELSKQIAKGNRAFLLPCDNGKWNLKNSDWNIKHNNANPENYQDSQFKQLEDESKGIGDGTNPVLAVLDLHWQYLQFEYYDRFNGETKWSKKPISILQMMIEGYAKQQKDNDEAKQDELTTVCNWDIGEKDIELVQCLPWIIRRKENDNSELNKPDKESTLRFQTDKSQRFIKSLDMSREFAPADDNNESAPKDGVTVNVDRLRYYDLPAEWRSTCYFCRLSENADDQDFFEMMVARETTKEKPLIFSLDDIVLTDSDLKPITLHYQNPEDSNNRNDRIALFSHKFAGPAWSTGKSTPTLLPKEKRGDNGDQWIPPKPQVRTDRASPELSPDGLYLHETGSDQSYLSAVITPMNYVADYPDWTRVVFAQGNVHDVFDQRTPVKNRDDKSTPVGARAAVRWEESATSANRAGQQVSSRPAMVRYPDGNGNDEEKLFATQALFEQIFVQSNWRDREQRYGRVDPIMLRCCDRDSDKKEVAQVIAYSRVSYDFSAAGPADGKTQAEYQNLQTKNVAERWNGRDAHGETAEFLPQDVSIKLRFKVSYFVQVVKSTQAHFAWKLGSTPRSFCDSNNGSGELKPEDYQPTGEHGPDTFTACHEWGHATTQPDDYGEKWDSCSYDRLGYYDNIPGLPFDEDRCALMCSNLQIRGRNFWFLTEWARKASGVPLKLSYGADDKFVLPAHPEAPSKNYTTWPVANLRDQTVSTKGKFDLFLYMLGDDKTANNVLPLLSSSSSKFDSILVIQLRTWWWFYFTNHYNYVNDLAIVDTHWRDKVNHKFYGTGNVTVNGEQKQLSRCLILVQPRYLVHNFSGSAHWNNNDGTPMTDTDYSKKVSDIVSYSGSPHVGFYWCNQTNPVTQDSWAGQSFSFFNSRGSSSWQANLRNQTYSAFRESLGLTQGHGDITKTDLQPIVDKILSSAKIEDIS